MTQPSRIHEILQEMEADPQLGEQLRNKVLGDELLKLPAEVREQNRRLDIMLDEMRQENRRAQERFQESLDEMRQENRQVQEKVQEQLEALNQSNHRAELRMDRLEQDRSILKNMTTRWEAARYARTLARELNADYVRSLNSDDLERIAGAALTGGARRSFRPRRFGDRRLGAVGCKTGNRVHRCRGFLHRRAQGCRKGPAKRSNNNRFHGPALPSGSNQRSQHRRSQ